MDVRMIHGAERELQRACERRRIVPDPDEDQRPASLPLTSIVEPVESTRDRASGGADGLFSCATESIR
ncbi:MAG TPA: hypothetical protein VF006_17005 [Longimicrobium sp.]